MLILLIKSICLNLERYDKVLLDGAATVRPAPTILTIAFIDVKSFERATDLAAMKGAFRLAAESTTSERQPMGSANRAGRRTEVVTWISCLETKQTAGPGRRVRLLSALLGCLRHSPCHSLIGQLPRIQPRALPAPANTAVGVCCCQAEKPG